MTSALAIQTELFRAMTADQKVRIAHNLWIEARAVLESGVRGRQPTWSAEQIAAEVRELMRDAGP